ncbi:MAG TPA: hypothetical protein VFA03_13625 [Acetobacteraceae bacterium]|nr:hypothetical protein [Acetobacteraceae bacterium]
MIAGPETLDGGRRAFCIGLRLVSDRRQLGDATLQRCVRHVGYAVLDRFIETLQLRFGFRGAPAQLGDVAAPALIPFLAALQQLVHHLREA